MGRSNFNSFIPRAYAIVPIPQCTDDTSGIVDYDNRPGAQGWTPNALQTEYTIPPTGGKFEGTKQRLSTLIDFGTERRNTNPLRAAVAWTQGAMYSFVGASGSAGTQTLDIRATASPQLTTPLALPAGAQTHLSGVIGPSWRAAGSGGVAAYGNNVRFNSQHGRAFSLFVSSPSATHTCVRPALGMVITPVMYAGGGTEYPYPDIHHTYYPGCVKGFYLTVPMGDANLASGQTDATIRVITVPITMKLHEICFSAATSAVGNSLKIKNLTTGQNITGPTGLTSTTASAVRVLSTSMFQARRILTKGDVIAITGITGGTGMTRVAAMLTGHTLDHFNVASPHLDTGDISAVAQTVDPASIFRNQSSAWIGRTNFSGPCKGGVAFFQLPVNAGIGTSQANFPVSRVIAPFDCTLFYGNATYRGSGASNTLAIHNVTTDLALTADTASVNTGIISTNWGRGEVQNVAISKGDTIELRADTAGTAGFAYVGGFIAVHVTGHVNANPVYD